MRILIFMANNIHNNNHLTKSFKPAFADKLGIFLGICVVQSIERKPDVQS